MQTLKTLSRRLLPVAGLLLLPTLASAGDLGVAIKGGTLGFGIEGDYILSEHFSVRVQANRYDYDTTYDDDEIEYDGALDLSTFGAILDWHPFGGGFRLSAGVYSNGNELTGTARGVGEYEIGDETYTVDTSDTLRLNTDVELGDGMVPYLGLGWGHSPTRQSGLLFSFELGVLMQGDPSVDLTASGTANSGTVNFATDPTVQAELTKEETNLESDLDDFSLYPVISLGIGYRF